MTDLSKLERRPLHHNPDGQTPPAPVVAGHIVAAQQEEEVRQEGYAPAATQIPAARMAIPFLCITRLTAIHHCHSSGKCNCID